MKRVLTAQEMVRVDQLAIEHYGISSLVLMENAGRAAAIEVMKDLPSQVCIVCGCGNNAGDGFVIARYLLDADIRVEMILIGEPENLKSDARVNYQILKRLISNSDNDWQVTVEKIQNADVVVDAIFGVGLNRAIDEPYLSVIAMINQHAGKVISIDVPSGLDATTGTAFGTCVKAYKTITFSCAKTGFVKADGPQYCGQVKVVDIGIPKEVFEMALKP